MNASSAGRLARSPIHLLHRASRRGGRLRVGGGGRKPYPSAARGPHQDCEARRSQPNRIVDLTGIDRSMVADMVRRMVKKGLLQRRRTTNVRRDLVDATKRQMVADMHGGFRTTKSRSACLTPPWRH